MKRDSNCHPTQIPHPSSTILRSATGLLLTVAWIVIPSNTESQPLPPELFLSGTGVETIQINGLPNTVSIAVCRFSRIVGEGILRFGNTIAIRIGIGIGHRGVPVKGTAIVSER